MLLFLALACSPSAADLLLGDARGVGGHTPVSGAITIDAPRAFDPIAGGPLSFTVTSQGDGSHLDVALLSATDEVMLETSVTDTEVTLTWDGKTPTGLFAAGGTFKIRTESWLEHPLTGERVVIADEMKRVNVVRAGFVTAWAEDDGGTTALRVPLYWTDDADVQSPSDAIATLVKLDDDDAPRDFAPLADPSAPATLSSSLRNPTQPLAYTFDSRPILTFDVGKLTTLRETGLDLVDISVQAAGWTVIGGLPLREGTPVTMQRDEPLGDSLGVTEESVDLSFVVDEDGAVLSTQSFPLRVYRVLDAPTFDHSDLQYSAWVAAIDPALRALEGTAPDPGAIRDALVDWIFWDNGLVYDHRRGASAYVNYLGGSWGGGHFDFTAFLARSRGTIVNCTDCAHILLTYANMLGAPLYYRIIQGNFPLNELLAIGSGQEWLDTGEGYSRCPFPPSGCGFSYHAVTSLDESTIWDATLALDGDEDPVNLPSELLMVQDVPADEYLWRLSTSTTTYYHQLTQGTLQ